jgi:UDP-hydrolysing UDP-N-acetyl-D-glucosamine 2-epimerase
MPKKTICVITATRAEYGLLRGLLRRLKGDPTFELQLIVTGAHLSEAHGATVREIERDGFRIDVRVPMLDDKSVPPEPLREMSRCLVGVGEALAKLVPELVVVLGDRYELLPICSAALMLKLPIAHISGGDVTEGALDNQVRHAVTKLAHLHFPGTEASARRIVQMGEDPAHVFAVGEPGIDNFVEVPRRPREELALTLGADPADKWVAFAYHPETLQPIARDLEHVSTALDLLLAQHGVQVIATHPNADPGGREIAELLEARQRAAPDRLLLSKSLGQDNFVGLLREAVAIVGNSSAGLVEAPSVPLAAIDIGERQRGRLRASNVVHASGSRLSLETAWATLESTPFRDQLLRCQNPYGDGHTAEHIHQILARTATDALLKKSFHAPDRR